MPIDKRTPLANQNRLKKNIEYLINILTSLSPGLPISYSKSLTRQWPYLATHPVLYNGRIRCDERSVVEREVETRVRPSRAVGELVDYYELDRCVQFVEAGEFKKVALQFPDDLLADSTSLASILEQKTGAKMYILADTSYGSCCVDKITAQHVNADCLIHFGHVSFIPPGHLPVLCVFGCEPIDCEDCVLKFKSLFPDVTSHVLIMSDVIYYHAQDLVVSRLVDKYSNLVASVIADRELATTKDAKCVDCQCGSKDKDRQDLKQVMEDDEKLPEVNNIWQSLLGRKFGLAVEKSLHDYAVFYIGCEGPVLTNFMMCMNKCQVSFNPIKRQQYLNILLPGCLCTVCLFVCQISD
jgi:diphthamide biosynthesis protein 2